MYIWAAAPEHNKEASLSALGSGWQPWHYGGQLVSRPPLMYQPGRLQLREPGRRKAYASSAPPCSGPDQDRVEKYGPSRLQRTGPAGGRWRVCVSGPRRSARWPLDPPVNSSGFARDRSSPPLLAQGCDRLLKGGGEDRCAAADVVTSNSQVQRRTDGFSMY